MLGPSSGSQACGDVGAGRLLETDDIVSAVVEHLSTGALSGRHVVITAGPTREPICPVRYISNRSSGKMGYALAEACINAGAKTTLISGPVSCAPPSGATVINVETTQEMFDASMATAATADIFIGAAAVVDFRPTTVSDRKIKRSGIEAMDLSLVPNPDIIASVADSKARPKLVVGFAAETHDVQDYARKKLASKSLDFIFANDVSDQAIGFNSEHNAGCSWQGLRYCSANVFKAGTRRIDYWRAEQSSRLIDDVECGQCLERHLADMLARKHPGPILPPP